jgi:hypothetical protein
VRSAGVRVPYSGETPATRRKVTGVAAGQGR